MIDLKMFELLVIENYHMPANEPFPYAAMVAI